MYIYISTTDDMLPNDSICQIRIKSTALVSSSDTACRCELLFNKIKFEAQLLAERERQAIEVEELRLRQRKEIDVKMAIFALEAEEKVLKEFVSVTGGVISRVGNQRNKKPPIYDK